jgi:hypothetical protein
MTDPGNIIGFSVGGQPVYAKPSKPLRLASQSMIETIEIMDERGNQGSDIVWEIAVHYSRSWNFTERVRMAWQIVRGKG